jgi:hypothetical protein
MFLKRNAITNFLPEIKARELYRQVFSSPQGQKVLCDMLIDLCFFDEIEDDGSVSFEEKAHLRSYANKILNKCGSLNPKNVEQIVRALIKLPIK